MIETFADTFYYLAVLNPRDAAHQAARTAHRGRTGRLITTQWVLTEVADALSTPANRIKFLTLLEQIEADPDVIIVPATDDWFRRSVDLYRRRPDKDWPLTDCISFVVMTEMGITEALTGDHHFKQAGFVPLLALA